ncbi:YitT family protein [Clostridium sp. AWRP]|nr:YitT family protein [Clostridium sp. AWRP]
MVQSNFFSRKNTTYYYIKQYFEMMLGCIITALGFNLFLKPNQIASGG